MMTKAPLFVAAYDWTGFHVGGNAGYGVGHDGTGVGRTIPPFPVLTPELFTFAPAGWLGGVQAGYDWQLARNWVGGLEADYQRAGQRDGACVLSCELTFGEGLTAQQKLNWFSTLRGRFGYAYGSALFYLTGGVAIAGVQDDLQSTSGRLTTSASFNHTKTGWVAGGGLEAALGGNWSGRIEYLHLDLGSVSDSFSSPSPFVPALTTSLSSNLHNDLVRVGLNYRLTGTGR
jgi:outer membrane immunogenic protein